MGCEYVRQIQLAEERVQRRLLWIRWWTFRFHKSRTFLDWVKNRIRMAEVWITEKDVWVIMRDVRDVVITYFKVLTWNSPAGELSVFMQSCNRFHGLITATVMWLNFSPCPASPQSPLSCGPSCYVEAGRILTELSWPARYFNMKLFLYIQISLCNTIQLKRNYSK